MNHTPDFREIVQKKDLKQYQKEIYNLQNVGEEQTLWEQAFCDLNPDEFATLCIHYKTERAFGLNNPNHPLHLAMEQVRDLLKTEWLAPVLEKLGKEEMTTVVQNLGVRWSPQHWAEMQFHLPQDLIGIIHNYRNDLQDSMIKKHVNGSLAIASEGRSEPSESLRASMARLIKAQEISPVAKYIVEKLNDDQRRELNQLANRSGSHGIHMLAETPEGKAAQYDIVDQLEILFSKTSAPDQKKIAERKLAETLA